jgi:Rps23 Pro-64 3,4-dihydroxylase Tpa1-like proline 4-hydroxylase|tara:strand:+ start:2564 stop:3148 length:585 start_codon:yes stop_codon:yes gene_type:complete
MHISANIDDCAIIIENFLEDNYFKKVSNFNFSNLDLTNSHENWEKNLFKENNQTTMNEVIQTKDHILEYEKGKLKKCIDPLFEEIIQTLINCSFIPYQFNSSITFSYYEYNKFSGINWHNDGHYTLSYSFYIMDEWLPNWGGETLIDTKRGMPLASTPKPNSILAIKNGILHKVCPVTGPKKRKVLQIRNTFYE